MREKNETIFKEWLPNSNDYEIAAWDNIQIQKIIKCIDDEKYYSEILILIKKKIIVQVR